MTYKCLFPNSWSLVNVNDARKCQNCRYYYEKSLYPIHNDIKKPQLYSCYLQKSLFSSEFIDNTLFICTKHPIYPK